MAKEYPSEIVDEPLLEYCLTLTLVGGQFLVKGTIDNHTRRKVLDLLSLESRTLDALFERT